jgi:hypothetical protein
MMMLFDDGGGVFGWVLDDENEDKQCVSLFYHKDKNRRWIFLWIRN